MGNKYLTKFHIINKITATGWNNIYNIQRLLIVGLPHLHEAPREIEKGDDPQEGVIGHHDVRMAICELRKALPCLRGEIDDEEGRGDDQREVVRKPVATHDPRGRDHCAPRRWTLRKFIRRLRRRAGEGDRGQEFLRRSHILQPILGGDRQDRGLPLEPKPIEIATETPEIRGDRRGILRALIVVSILESLRRPFYLFSLYIYASAKDGGRRTPSWKKLFTPL